MLRLRTGFALAASALVLLAGLFFTATRDRSDSVRDESAVVGLASRWVASVAARDPALVELLDTSAADYYERLRDVALHGDVTVLEALAPTDQLQALFLRLTVDLNELEEMSGRQILLKAVHERWIGQDLRRTDEIRELVVTGDAATGRLYKFGQEDRPDRGRQYFRRENGEWRVELRGERERLQQDFEAFVARSGLGPSEAAFFILETRLLRKVRIADFVPPLADRGTAILGNSVPKNRATTPQLRIVAVRESPDDPRLTAVTLEDREGSLRSVLSTGDTVGDENGYRLLRIEGDRAWLERDGAEFALDLDRRGPPLDQRPRARDASATEISLLEQARLGEYREGLMTQWRNVGLRGRPQLLQQAWLVPEIGEKRDTLLGLRVRKLVENSFWHQIGLAEGDLVERVNGVALDSMARWQELLRSAGGDQEISVIVERDGRTLRFQTETVPPHSMAGHEKESGAYAWNRR